MQTEYSFAIVLPRTTVLFEEVLMSTPAAPLRTRWRFATLFGLAGSLVVGLIVLAFVWPAATMQPRGLPVGIAGPAAQVTALEHALAGQDPDPLAFTRVSSRADAVDRIRSRAIVGAVLLGGSPEVLTTSAAGSAQNQLLRGIGAQVQVQVSSKVEGALVTRVQRLGTTLGAVQQAVEQGRAPQLPGAQAPSAAPSSIPTVRVTDVVPLSADDPIGAGLSGASFPLVLGGMLGGVLVSLLVVGAVRRLVALLVYGAAAGVVVTLVLQTWLHVLQRDWLLNAGAFGLAMLATAAVVVGFTSLIGTPGIAVGAVVSLLIGTPISGAAIPPQFLAGPWGAVGQAFVPGAASTLVRSLSYFPDADTSAQWWTLVAWAAAGLLLTVVGRFRSLAPVPLPAGELDPA
jgi:hypothetical protein